MNWQKRHDWETYIFLLIAIPTVIWAVLRYVL